MRSYHCPGCCLYCWIVRYLPPRFAAGAQERLFGWAEHYFMLTAGKPLGNAEHAFRIVNRTGKLAYSRRHCAHSPWRDRQPESLSSQFRVLLEYPRAEQIPVPGQACWREVVPPDVNHVDP